MVDLSTFNRGVAGSIPAGGTMIKTVLNILSVYSILVVIGAFFGNTALVSFGSGILFGLVLYGINSLIESQ